MNAATIVSIMKPNITSLGYGLFLAINAAGVWGGVFPFLPMEFQTTEIVFWFFLAQSLVFSFSYFASAWDRTSSPAPRAHSSYGWPPCPTFDGAASSRPSIWTHGRCRSSSAAARSWAWGRPVSTCCGNACSPARIPTTGNRDLIKGTLYAAVLYFSLYLIPQAVTAFLIPLVFLPLFGLTIVLKSREIDLDQAMFQDVPRDHPLVYQRLVNDYWRSALCVARWVLHGHHALPGHRRAGGGITRERAVDGRIVDRGYIAAGAVAVQEPQRERGGRLPRLLPVRHHLVSAAAVSARGVRALAGRRPVRRVQRGYHAHDDSMRASFARPRHQRCSSTGSSAAWPTSCRAPASCWAG